MIDREKALEHLKKLDESFAGVGQILATHAAFQHLPADQTTWEGSPNHQRIVELREFVQAHGAVDGTAEDG